LRAVLSEAEGCCPRFKPRVITKRSALQSHVHTHTHTYALPVSFFPDPEILSHDSTPKLIRGEDTHTHTHSTYRRRRRRRKDLAQPVLLPPPPQNSRGGRIAQLNETGITEFFSFTFDHVSYSFLIHEKYERGRPQESKTKAWRCRITVQPH